MSFLPAILNHLPLLQELFEPGSGSIIFLIIGLSFAIFVGAHVEIKAQRIGTLVCAAIYIICEIIFHFPKSYLMEILLLMVGTVAVGSLLGFFVLFLINYVKDKLEDFEE